MNKLANMIGKGYNAVKRCLSNGYIKTVAVGTVLLGLAQQKASAIEDIVTYSNGDVSFVPSALVGPVVTGVVAAVSAGAVLVVISVGVRWIYRQVKTR